MEQQILKQKIIRAIKQDPNKSCIKSISLFGSYLHNDFKKNSDIDLLLELKKNIGLFTLVAIQLNFEKEIGKKVDLVTKDSLSKYIRDDVLNEAEKIYES
jgi:predicted nucleotidyltransferase